MRASEAIDRILIHAGFSSSEERGLLHSLRPYTGLDERHYVDLILAVAFWHEDIQRTQKIDKIVPAALWEVCWVSRLLALRVNSPLRRNALISPEDVSRLEHWIDSLEAMCVRSLSGVDLPVCLTRVFDYIVQHSHQDMEVYLPLVPVIQDCVKYDDADISSGASEALGRIYGLGGASRGDTDNKYPGAGDTP